MGAVQCSWPVWFPQNKKGCGVFLLSSDEYLLSEEAQNMNHSVVHVLGKSQVCCRSSSRFTGFKQIPLNVSRCLKVTQFIACHFLWHRANKLKFDTYMIITESGLWCMAAVFLLFVFIKCSPWHNHINSWRTHHANNDYVATFSFLLESKTFPFLSGKYQNCHWQPGRLNKCCQYHKALISDREVSVTIPVFFWKFSPLNTMTISLSKKIVKWGCVYQQISNPVNLDFIGCLNCARNCCL